MTRKPDTTSKVLKPAQASKRSSKTKSPGTAWRGEPATVSPVSSIASDATEEIERVDRPSPALAPLEAMYRPPLPFARKATEVKSNTEDHFRENEDGDQEEGGADEEEEDSDDPGRRQQKHNLEQKSAVLKVEIQKTKEHLRKATNEARLLNDKAVAAKEKAEGKPAGGGRAKKAEELRQETLRAVLEAKKWRHTGRKLEKERAQMKKAIKGLSGPSP